MLRSLDVAGFDLLPFVSVDAPAVCSFGARTPKAAMPSCLSLDRLVGVADGEVFNEGAHVGAVSEAEDATDARVGVES